MIDKAQVEQIKDQLFSQLDQTNLPNKEEIKASIKTMNEEQLEQFLVQNKIMQQGESQGCIFCSIAEGKVPGYKIAENSESLAVLEINPISKGHTIIIPKIHTKDSPKKAIELAQEVADKIKQFNPKKIDVIPQTLFDHEILNVLPIYGDETLDSPKQKAEKKELEEMQKILSETKSAEIEKEKPLPELTKPKLLTDKDTWLPKRKP